MNRSALSATCSTPRSTRSRRDRSSTNSPSLNCRLPRTSTTSSSKPHSYFDTEQFRFHGPGGFEADYSGLTNYFRSVRAAFDDRSIRRGIMIVEGNYVACQTWTEEASA